MIELQIAFMYMSKKDAREWLKSPQGIGYKNWMLRGAPENEIEGELNGNA